MKRQRIGMAVGLLGNFMFGWGLYHLMGIGNCGGYYAPCPDSSWVYFLAMPVGIIVSILSIFVGGALIFLTTFATVGVASILRGINGGVGGDGDPTFPFVFGGLFLLPAVLPLVLAVAAVPYLRRNARRKQGLVQTGARATATVTSVRDTGTTINNSPFVELSLSVQPDGGGAPFEINRKLTVSRLAIPRVGDHYPLWYDPRDPSRFRLGDLVQRAPHAATEPATGWVSELGRLNDLRLSGALTDEEFNRAKDRLLSGSPPAPAGG